MIELTELQALPEGFARLKSPQELYTLMPNPTLVHLSGRREPRLFVTVLLHGNEDTGFYAVQQLLQKYHDKPLPRSLSIFFGNVSAAAQGLRRFDDQPDYNRVWPSTELADCAETRLMAKVTAIMAAKGLFASIDVHNNTGKNPHYSCINTLTNRALQLARLFSPIVVYCETPRGVQSMAMTPHCPAVTIECGKPGVSQGVEHVLEFLEAALHLNELPDHPVPPQDIQLYQTLVRVTLPEDFRFSFHDSSADIHLLPALDRYNFSELAVGTSFGESQHAKARLLAWDEANFEVGEQYFTGGKGQIQLKLPLMPAMLTLDETIIRQDCLCYLMKRLAVETQARDH